MRSTSLLIVALFFIGAGFYLSRGAQTEPESESAPSIAPAPAETPPAPPPETAATPAPEPPPPLSTMEQLEKHIPQLGNLPDELPADQNPYLAGGVSANVPKSFKADGLGFLNTRPLPTGMEHGAPTAALGTVAKPVAALEQNSRDLNALRDGTLACYLAGKPNEMVPFLYRYLKVGGKWEGLADNLNSALSPACVASELRRTYIKALADCGYFAEARKQLAEFKASLPGYGEAELAETFMYAAAAHCFLQVKDDLAAAGACTAAMITGNPAGPYLDLENSVGSKIIEKISDRFSQNTLRDELPNLDVFWPFASRQIVELLLKDFRKARLPGSEIMVASADKFFQGRNMSAAALVRRSIVAKAREKDLENCYKQIQTAVTLARAQNDPPVRMQSLLYAADEAQRVGDLQGQIDYVKEAEALVLQLIVPGYLLEAKLRRADLLRQLSDARGALELYTAIERDASACGAALLRKKAEQGVYSAALECGAARLVEAKLRADAEWADKYAPGMGAKVLPFYTYGCCLARLGRHADAIKYFKKALPTPNVEYQLRSYLQLGQIYLKDKDGKAAEESFREALAIEREMKDPESRWIAIYGLSRALLLQGNVPGGQAVLSEALNVIEEQRASVKDFHLRRTLQDNKQDVYRLAMEQAVKAGDHKEAFALAERSRARMLLDLLGQNTTVAELSAVQQASSNCTSISFIIGNNEIWAWIIDPQETSFVRLPMDAGALMTELGALYSAVNPKTWRTADDSAWRKPLNTLYEKLWVPLLPRLTKAERIAIFPHSILHLVPFQALHDGKQFLIERHTIFYAPSGSSLVELRRRPAVSGGDTLLFDPILSPDPKSPYGVTETAALAKIFPQAARLASAAATIDAFKQTASKGGIIHISSHGGVDDWLPSRSGLLFWQHGKEQLFSAEEIAQLKLPKCNLVVLSACLSSVGDHAGGEELTGVTRAFQLAGATNVVGSLWEVGNTHTTRLMTLFYERLKAQPGDPTAALAAAQREFLKTSPHPFGWAAFQISGAGK